MKFQESFQCSACSSYLSHPIDTCPVCGDQFYWMVQTTRDISPDEKDAYIARMKDLVEGKATPGFMTHGELIWLPHRYWDFDPTGDVLEEFTWLREVDLVQHEGEAREKPDANVWDTLPGQPVPDFNVTDTAKGLPVETLRAPTIARDKEQARAAVARSERTEAARAKREDQLSAHLSMAESPLPDKPTGNNKRKPAQSGSAGRALIPQQFFGPLMILLFFLFLSASYLVLRYHYNTNAVSGTSTAPTPTASTEDVTQ